MSDEPDKPKVGYGKPPMEHRFKKGQSGNPRGRGARAAQPKIAIPRAVSSIILEEAYRPVSVREGDQVIELPVITAVLRGLNLTALKGNRQAQIAVAGMVQVAQAEAQAGRLEFATMAIDYKRHWAGVFAECDRTGRPRPNVLPHPDHVIVDELTADVQFLGPIDAQEKAAWDAHAELEQTVLASLERDRKALRRSPKRRAELEDSIATLERQRLRLQAYSPDEIARRGPSYDPAAALKRLQPARLTLADPREPGGLVAPEDRRRLAHEVLQGEAGGRASVEDGALQVGR